MARTAARPSGTATIYYYPAREGSRAVFLAEAPSRKLMREARRLFDQVGQFAEVVPLSSGSVMSYAVQMPGGTALFDKLESLLKTQFPFSVVDRNYSAATFHLVQVLCGSTGGQLAEVPGCGVCSSPEPFPTRIIVDRGAARDGEHGAYCLRCVREHTHPESQEITACALLQADQRELEVPAKVGVVVMPEMVDQQAATPDELMAIAG